MSPILVRPVREQLEHDRLIRHLEGKYRKKLVDVALNVGDERTNPVKIGTHTYFPDLVLTSGRTLVGLIEVESGESVNNLEALAQWVHFARARAPFHLYVPVNAYDAARRLCEAHHAKVAEIWTYRALLEGFDLVRMHHDTSVSSRNKVASAADASKEAPVAKVSAKRPAKAPPKSAKTGKPPKTTTSKAKAKAKAKPAARTKPAAKTSRGGKKR